MRILVTGGTGFTGSYVVPLLLREGATVRCLVRRSSDTRGLPADRVELVQGDLDDQSSLEHALSDADALVNIASLGFGHAGKIVEAALAAAVKRAVFISTTAVFTTTDAHSKSVRLAAEDAVRTSGLAYTLLRPTMIYGSSRDRNMCRLIRYVQRWPVLPVFGDGQSLQQPVYVGDVAGAIVKSLASPKAVGRCYDISGAAPLTYNQVVDTVCSLTGRKVRKIHLATGPIVKALALFERLGLRLPIKAEQVIRLNEDKAFDFTDATRDFGYEPLSFEEGVGLELQEMAVNG